MTERFSTLKSPWAWVLAGLFLELLAAAVNFIRDDSLAVPVGIVVSVGLLLTGIGVALGLALAVPDRLSFRPGIRPIVPLLLALFQAAVVALFTWILIAAILEMDPFHPGPRPFGYPSPIKIGPALIAWLFVVPLTVHGVRRLLASSLEPFLLEKGTLLALACAVVLLAGRALPASAETMKFFLAVLAFVVAFGVSLVLAIAPLRQLVLSLAAVVHFLGIVTATLASPPSPWLITQVWNRLAHPYLEFMYLNNAYHFYSPDPGPATYLWMRVVYYDPKSVGPDGDPPTEAVWFKLPDMDGQGRHRYRVSLEYQRHLSLTENLVASEALMSMTVLDKKTGEILPTELFKNRLANSPSGSKWQQEIIGREAPQIVLKVPLHEKLTPESQYQKPTPPAQRLIASYVRYACDRPHPEHPEWTAHSVRVYRVVHSLPKVSTFIYGGDPNDPETYHAYYTGWYKPDGSLIDPAEPLLYWLLPAVREDPDHPSSRVWSWAMFHAGDNRCIYDPKTKEWVAR